MKALFTGKSIWWQRPKMRTDADEDLERKASWLELFFDLMFVAVLSELSSFLHGKHSFEGVLQFIFLYVPIWWMWNGLTFYNERYEVNDVRHRVLTFISMLPIAGMAYGVQDAFGSKFNFLVVCHIISRGILSYMWCTAGYTRLEKKMSLIFSLGLWLSMLFLAVSLFIPSPFRYILWGVALIIDLVTPLFSLSTQAKLPRISTSHLPERFGLLVILAIGETVIGSVKGMSEHETITFSIALCFILSFIVSFIIWWLYTDHVLYRVFRKGIWFALAWCYLHLPLTICITAVGSALHGIVSIATSDSVPAYLHWLLTGFLVAFLFIIGLLGLVSESADHHHHVIEFERKVNRELFLIKMFCVALIVTIVGVCGQSFVPVLLLTSSVLILVVPAFHGLNLWVKSHLLKQQRIKEDTAEKNLHHHSS